jgi:hypothetical protein
MNIFAVSPDPALCAQTLDDKRLVKMVLETAQLLCVAVAARGCEDERLYKPTHPNHPCAVWVRKDQVNLSWTINLFQELCVEYTARFRKVHACETRLLDLFRLFYETTETRPHVFCNCSRYKDDGDTHTAYQATLREKWEDDQAAGRPAKWTRQSPPYWMIPG